ncbi:prion-like-(Q/N-rich) domain-bearing protein 25 [Littorina saxatilis]|uniref:prion-like-(Q/N-rich) domain-bearing protein 25 n=1 Tax=Littorina saxatilis TaxID=31220 RepID=UPI0038B5889D
MRRLPLTWRLKAKYCRRESICRAMAPSTLSLFLTALMFAGALGADIGLGGKCTASDSCVSTPPSVCDKVVKRCLIKQGQSCAGTEFAKMCVSGATCESNMCACKASIYIAATDECALDSGNDGKWLFTCTASGSECSDASTRCIDNVCVCNAGKAVDLATGTCTGTISNEKVGKVCADNDKTTTCGAASTNLECPSGGGVCDCTTDYFGPLNGVCSPAPGKIGGGCSTAADCTATDNTCSSNVCKVSLGGTCTADDDCLTPADMDCDDLTKKCSLKTAQTCNTPVANKDKCVSGATCDATTNNCKCIATPTVYTDTANLCKATTGKVTGDCTSGTTCDDANAECDSGSTRCICKTGYTLKVADATCEKSGAISVIASALTVMLVAASGRLFSLH